MFKASEIMNTQVVTVGEKTPIYEAVQILVDHNLTGLPVIREDGTLVGIVSEKDVLSLLFNVKDRQGKVEDFMTKTVISFDVNDSLIEISECLIRKPFRRVPITSQGKLKGIISRRDIISYILHFRHAHVESTG